MRLKKLLGSVLALALMFPYGQANAELLKNLKLTGQIDLQTQSSRNVTDFTTRPNAADFRDGVDGLDRTFNDRINDAQTRIMLNMDWDWLDDVHSKVSIVKRDRTWGSIGTVAGADARGQAQPIGSDAAGTVLGTVYVDQAYFKLDKMMGHVDVTAGRQHYGTPGDLVIYYGPSDKALYGLPTTALDVVRVDAMPGWMGLKITGLAGKITGSPLSANGINATATRDVDLNGLKFDLKPADSIDVGAHIYRRLTHAIGAMGHTSDNLTGAAVQPGLNNSLFVYGLKFRWQEMGFNIGAEWNKNSGEDRALVTRDGDGDGNIIEHIGGGGACAGAGVDVNGDGICNHLDLVPDSKYVGQAFKIDASYTAEAEGIATFVPWFNIAQGTGRSAVKENRNEGFVAIRGDYRPGTIYGRFAPTGLVSLGSGIPCLQGADVAVGYADADADGIDESNPYCTAAGIFSNTNLGTNTGGSGAGVGINGLNNRLVWGIGMKVTPAAVNQLTLGVSWWNFRLQRDTDFSYSIGNGASFGLPNSAQLPAVAGRNGLGNGNKDIGSELDIDFNWKHSDNVGLDFGLAGFKPGKYIQSIVEDARAADPATQAGISPVYMAYADLRVKF